jgi:hypothetical protein
MYHGTSAIFESQILENGFLKSFDTYDKNQIVDFCEEVLAYDSDLKNFTKLILDKYQNDKKTRTSFTADFTRACFYALRRKGGLINEQINLIFERLNVDNLKIIKQNYPDIVKRNTQLNNCKCIVFAIVLNEDELSKFSTSMHGAIHLNQPLRGNCIAGKALLQSNLNPPEIDGFIDNVTCNSQIFQKIYNA